MHMYMRICVCIYIYICMYMYMYIYTVLEDDVPHAEAGLKYSILTLSDIHTYIHTYIQCSKMMSLTPRRA